METQLIQQVDPATILRPPQIRKLFAVESIAEMAESIREVGIQSPILAYQEKQDLILLDGERRVRAAILLGLEQVPVLVQEKPVDPAAIVQRQLILNAQREDLSPIEKAQAVDLLIKESGCTASGAAKKIGKSPAQVSKFLSLLTLSAEAQEKIAAGQMTIRDGYRLARSGDSADVAVPSSPKPPRRQKLTAILDPLRKVIVEGVDSSMDAFINALETVLARCKTARKQGIELPTFLAMLRDQAGL